MMKTLKQCHCTQNQILLAERYGLHEANEVFSLYPFRYEEMISKPFNQWQEKEKVVFEGRLMTYPVTTRFGKNKAITRFQVETEDNLLNITIFNRPWNSNLKVGMILTIIGRYEGYNKVTAMQYNTKPLKGQLGIIPVYPLKEGIQQRSVRALIKKVFLECINEIEDFVPSDIQIKYKLMNKKMALRCIHFPQNSKEIQLAYRTLKYEEFLRFHLAIAIMKSSVQEEVFSEGKKFDRVVLNNLIDELPFDFTLDQKKATEEILDDMEDNRVMYRLVQGDVGCGKTAVAWVAMVACVMAKKQAAMMAPTEILAKQHYESFMQLSNGLPIKIEVLYSALSAKKKKEILEKLKNHEIDILIGTHALIQDAVQFADLGLVVADEQHRFGVEQRKKLKEKGNKVDFLLMTATPIPRTLANTLYGDMDISTIVTMPKGRKPVITRLIKENKLDSLTDELIEALKSNEQIYVICAAIEESENYEAKNVIEVQEELQVLFQGVAKCGILHGKMSSDEKEEIMRQFSENQIQILVSTTVVEVGVNVVNATTMIIYDAHRFGLSSLHQLRGRVQRGNKQGKCYLLTSSKDKDALKRLEILVNCSDGFEISMEDLKIRGPGDILGIRQSGLPGFVLGNLIEDTRIIDTARKDAQDILENQENIEYLRCIEIIKKLNQNTASYMD